MSLFEACKKGDYELVKSLVEKDIDIVRTSYTSGETALIYACRYGSKEICELLIEKGANVHYKDDYNGVSPLIVATKEGQKHICELLIANGVDVNAKVSHINGTDEFYNEHYIDLSALLVASKKGYKEICELLIKNGANVNITNKYGKTPLMCASANGHKEICELLIEKGADKLTGALINATINGHREICELLIEKGANVNGKCKKYDCVCGLYNKSTKHEYCWEHKSKYGNMSVLMFAIINVQEDICKLLIANGADVESELLWACKIRKRSICMSLIHLGAFVKPYGKAHLMMHELGWKDLYKKVVWNRRKHLIGLYY